MSSTKYKDRPTLSKIKSGAQLVHLDFLAALALTFKLPADGSRVLCIKYTLAVSVGPQKYCYYFTSEKS
jgi:hypothetical protein